MPHSLFANGERSDSVHMKSQDLLVLSKLAVMHRRDREVSENVKHESLRRETLAGWSDYEESSRHIVGAVGDPRQWTYASLALALGMSASEVNASVKRSLSSGIARQSRATGKPIPNSSAFRDFIMYGVQYVFPATPGRISRGIPTSFAAPVLKSEILSPGSTIPVWPDPYGKEMGCEVEPLYRSVPAAVRRDMELYALLALIDVFRIGHARERNIAVKKLDDLISSL